MNSASLERLRPPLDTRRDLNREQADRLLAVPHQLVSPDPDLTFCFTQVSQVMGDLRRGLGLSLENFSLDSVRLIEPAIYDSHRDLSDYTSGAFFDPYTRICFIRFSESEYISSTLERFMAIYTVAHELSHKGMDNSGIMEYSLHLNEGLTELHVRNVLEGRVFPKLFYTCDYREREYYINDMNPTIDGFVLSAQDLVYSDPIVGTVVYSRVPEMHLVQLIEKSQPALYKSLVEAAFQGNPTKAKAVVSNVYGPDTANAFGDAKYSPRELVQMII